MHRHDLDLIAALAEGTLGDDTEARALVASCPDCREEYESQRTVLDWLAAAPLVEMSEHEQATLHRDLWTELRKPTGGSPRRVPWVYRWSYAAAALVVLVGLFAILNQMRGGDDAADLFSGETFSEIGSGLNGEPARQAGDDGLDTAEDQSGGGEAATETTTAAAEESSPISFSDLADEARARLADPVQDYYSDGDMPVDVRECLDENDMSDQIVVDLIEKEGVIYLLVAPADVAEGGPLNFIDAVTCEVAYVDN